MKLYFVLLFMFLSTIGSTTHIIGGHLEAIQTAPNLYTFKCYVYRDCQATSAAMPTALSVGIYYKQNNLVQQTLTFTNPVVTAINLGDSCVSLPGVCIEEGVFTYTNITIPDNTNGYIIQSQLYARSNGIINIQNSGSVGMTFYMEIPDPALSGMNSSPSFISYPNDWFFCQDSPRFFSIASQDADGDSLVYSLVTPLQSVGTSNVTSPPPYSDIPYASGYNLMDMIGGIPPLTCNSFTGNINASPSLVGIFVVGMKIEEFRNGIKIGEVRKDISIYSINCNGCFLSDNWSISEKTPHIYPNPAFDFIEIKTFENVNIIKIYDLNNQLIFSQLYNQEQIHIDLNNFPSGIYNTSIENKSSVILSKFIKL